MTKSSVDERINRLLQVSRRLALFAIVCAYVLVVLMSIDDAAMTFSGDATIVPFVNAKVQASVFLSVAPFLVLAAYQYFQASLLSAFRSHGEGLSVFGPADSTSLFDDILLYQSGGPRRVEEYTSVAISYFIVWLLAPGTVALCWYRSLTIHSSSISFYSTAMFVVLLGVSLKIWRSVKPRAQRRKPVGPAGLVAVGAAMILINAAFMRRIPSGCFEPKIHDQSHTFFDRSMIETECQQMSGTLYHAAQAWTLLGLKQGPDLRSANLGSSSQSKDKDQVKSLVFDSLDLTNARATGMIAPKAGLVDSFLVGTTLRAADLYDANLNRATILMADFREAKMSEVGLIRTRMKYVDFTSATMDHTFYRGSVIEHASFVGASMKRAVFDCTTLIDADLTGADFTDATFSSTRFIDSIISAEKLSDEQRKGICVNSRRSGSPIGPKLFDQCPSESKWQNACRQDEGPR